MKNKFIYIIVIILIFINFNTVFSQSEYFSNSLKKSDFFTETIESRITTPKGYKRIQAESATFAAYLRSRLLLATGSPVKDCRGCIKKSGKDTTVVAVVDYPIKGKKLEQCMDIIQRIWPEYLWVQHRPDKIYFYLPGGFLLKWKDWKEGFRPQYHGITVRLIKNTEPDSSRKTFEKYLWEIFYRSNTQTAYFAYPKVEPENVQIGYFVVKKGKRGHAVLIVDMAEDSLGKKIALIGHGDTPACQFSLLNYKKENHWFPIDPKDEYLPLPIKKKMYWDGLRRFEK